MKYVGLKIAVGEIVVGDQIAFSYSGKNRSGVVDKVHPNAVCVKLDSGGFKSFTLAKIKPALREWDVPQAPPAPTEISWCCRFNGLWVGMVQAYTWSQAWTKARQKWGLKSFHITESR